MNIHYISSETLTLEKIEEIISSKKQLQLSEEALHKIQSCRAYLDKKVQEPDALHYGINTGFGSLCNVQVPKEELEKLQYNLLVSHACGTGAEVPLEIVKIMLLLKIQSLSYGHSGVDVSTVWRLIDFYNLNILPVVYQQGSLGASGDLAPLAHLCLPLLGLGEVYVEGKRMSSVEMLQAFKWNALKLQSKEGLALLNGTQFMSSYGVFMLLKATKLIEKSTQIAAMSIDAFDARIEPFNTLIHAVRPHKGQVNTAKNIQTILADSEIIKTEKRQVQDPYSFRCIPQVHGATADVLDYVKQIFTTEINSVTDNPNVFPAEDIIISGGNFHGQPLALALDFLAIALAELGSISERRTYLLISGQRGLPPYLTPNAGTNSGFMITQYTAASIVSENKQLCTPASVDSIVSSNGQEDHVSMGANAATKCFRVVENIQTILAIELLNAAQGLDFRRPMKSSNTVEKLHQELRTSVPFLSEDAEMSSLIKEARKVVCSM